MACRSVQVTAYQCRSVYVSTGQYRPLHFTASLCRSLQVIEGHYKILKVSVDEC